MTPSAATNLASLTFQLGLTLSLGNLADTGPATVGKCLHALAATAIATVKGFFFFGLVGVVFRVFPATDVVLDTAAHAPTTFTPIFADRQSPLGLGHDTDACLLAPLCVFALATAVTVALIGLRINWLNFASDPLLAVHY